LVMVYIGAIVSRQPPGREECADGKFTTSENPGRCSRHGGVALPNCMKAKRRPTKEAQFRRDAAAAPKVIFISDPNQSKEVAPASIPKSVKPKYEGRCRFRNKVCRELDEKYMKLRALAYDKGIVDDNFAPGVQPKTLQQRIGHLLRDINTGILSITIKEDAGTIA